MKTLPLTFATATGLLALAGCATVNEAAVQAVSETQYASLSGREVVGAAADADGMANAQVSPNDEAGVVCYEIRDQRNLGTITSVMLHQGARGQSGPMLISFPRADDGEWKGCASDTGDAVEKGVERNPTAYYVMVETTTGAVRGQLREDK